MAAPANIERAFGVTKIKSHIPLILDLDDHNYDVWRELFSTHRQFFSSHWWRWCSMVQTWWVSKTMDLWNSGTWSFQEFFWDRGTARDICFRIENKFRNNKEACAIHLDNKLHITEIGDLSIEAYSQKLRSLSDRLANVDAPISDHTLCHLSSLWSKWKIWQHHQRHPAQRSLPEFCYC